MEEQTTSVGGTQTYFSKTEDTGKVSTSPLGEFQCVSDLGSHVEDYSVGDPLPEEQQGWVEGPSKECQVVSQGEGWGGVVCEGVWVGGAFEGTNLTISLPTIFHIFLLCKNTNY